MAYLGSAEHTQRVDDMLGHVDGITLDQRNTLVDEITRNALALRASLLDLIVEDDTSEAEIVLPYLWLEKRFEWMRLNSQMQYQTVFQGRADPVLMARGAALSDLIGVLESYLPPETAFFASKVAADPLGVARAELVRNERIFEALEVAGTGGRAAVGAILTASDIAERFSSDERVLGALESASATAIEAIGRHLRITVDDFRLALESEIAALLANSPVHIALETSTDDVHADFPALIARGMRKIVRIWLTDLVSTTSGPAARIATGRKANLTLSLNVAVQPGEFIMQLTDDGDGVQEFVLTPPDRTLRDMQISHDRFPGDGSMLTVRCGLRSVQEYLLVQASANESDATIAIALASIERMSKADPDDLAVHGLALQTAPTSGGMPIIDLGRCLYDSAVDSVSGMYVIVQLRAATGMQRTALRVHELHGICRGSVSYVPTHCKTDWLRGFIMNRRRMIGVLDLDRLTSPV